MAQGDSLSPPRADGAPGEGGGRGAPSPVGPPAGPASTRPLSRQALVLISTNLALTACGVAPSTGAAPSSAAPSLAAAAPPPAAPASQGPTANPTPPGTGAPDPTAGV